MKKIVRRSVESVLLLATLTLGCSAAGSQYVGKWVNSGNRADTMEISRNGDHFQITGAALEKIDANVAKDGTLQIPGVMGTNLTLTYEKSTDTLEGPGMFGPTVYKRVQ